MEGKEARERAREATRGVPGSSASTCKGPGGGGQGRAAGAGWEKGRVAGNGAQQGAGSRGTRHKDPIYIYFFLPEEKRSIVRGFGGE